MELLIVIRGNVEVSIAYERLVSYFHHSNTWNYEMFSIGEEAIVKKHLQGSTYEVEPSIAFIIEEREQDLVLIPARFKGAKLVFSKQVIACIVEIISIIMNNMLDIVEYIKITKTIDETV